MSNPTDNWDDWGDDTSSQPSTENTQQLTDDGWGDWEDNTSTEDTKQDDWGDWDSSNGQSQGSSDDWGDWSSDNQQADTQQNWDDWGSSTDQNQSDGSFINDSQDVNQNWSSQPQDYQTQNTQPVQTHFSTKTIAIIVAVVILGIALLLMGIDKIHLSKKPVSTVVPQQQQVVDNNQQGNNQQSDNSQGNNTKSTEQESESRGSQDDSSLKSATLVEIPDSTSMTYSNDTLKANGKVTDKKKYVQGKQVVYCVEITIAVGSSSETVNYYCTSATFNQVGIGDILIVNYVQVDDSYISITNVEK